MKVHTVMSKHITSVSSKTPFRDLWKAIFKKGLHALPVVDKNNKVIGIIAEADLLKPLYPDYSQFIDDFTRASNFEEMEETVHDLMHLTAEKIMNKRVVFTHTHTPILRALSRMIVQGVRQLPVVTEDLILVGMVSKGDIFDSLFKKHLRLKGFVKDKKKSLEHHLKKANKKA